MKTEEKDPSFERLLDYLKRSRGFDFSGYKRGSLMRRAERRTQSVGVDDFESYRDYLEVHPEEFTLLFNTILINVTEFFRDAPAWEYLEGDVLKRLIAQKRPDEPIRVWSAGCASGEEAYSLAILFAEALGNEQFSERVKIYATDVDEEALHHARQASYSAKALETIPDPLRDKYFEHSNGQHLFRGDLRSSVIFGRHDLLQDAPISRLDLLVCRNTLMYFNAETQNRILARFHFALTDPGFLFLGRAEMLLTHTDLFRPELLKCRLFSKIPKANLRGQLIGLAPTGDEEAEKGLPRVVRLRDVGFDAAPVAQVLVDLDGTVMQVNERARTLLSIAAKDVGRRLQDLELSYRPVELRTLIEQAYAERRAVTLTSVEKPLQKGAKLYLDVHVVPLQDSGGTLIGVSIVFNDVTHYASLQEQLQKSKQELESASEELQSTNEELETTNEELQSTVEELETTNEELHSTNEELETMNEELQSSNEELQTVNEELRERTDELNGTNSFLQSILASLRGAVVVIDDKTNVLVWTKSAEDLWGLRTEEVKGQPFLNLDIGLPVAELKTMIRGCLGGKNSVATTTLEATNRRGKAFQCRVECTALTGPDKQIHGAILVMA